MFPKGQTPENRRSFGPSGTLIAMDTRWGIDLGGTKIEGVVIREEAPDRPLCRIRIPTEAPAGYRHILGRVARLVERMEEEAGPRPGRIGIGTPGSVEPASGLMKNSNTVCLNGMPLLADLEAELGARVALANDADCFALAEATLGAGAGAAIVFGVILGTGVGGGIVAHGRLLQGPNGIAGEWGHNVLDPEGEACYCGKRGCVETVISGPGLERYYAGRTGSRLRLPEILSRTHDPNSAATRERLFEGLGRALSLVINVLDPDVVVLGGGVGQTRGLAEALPARLAPHVFAPRLRTRIVSPVLGDSAGVFGAALLNPGPEEHSTHPDRPPI
jgi:fructokinase